MIRRTPRSTRFPSTTLFRSDTTAAGTCANSHSETKTWDATDACGNHSATRTQTITVVDTTAPTIGAAGAREPNGRPPTPSFQTPSSSVFCLGATGYQINHTP